jgi:hypothetical protein
MHMRRKWGNSPIVEGGEDFPIRQSASARHTRRNRVRLGRFRYSALLLTSLTVTLGLAALAQPAGASSSQAAPHSSAAPSHPSAAPAPWEIQKTPPLDVREGQFNGISCTSVSNCMAVGDELNSKGELVALAEFWNGTSWSMTKGTNPPGTEGSELDSVSCVASECVAVGQSGEESPLAELWNGTSWTLQSVTTTDIFADLEGVSCPSPDLCRAVGFGETETGGEKVLAESWNGTTWTQTKGPKVSGAVASSFESVSCISAQFCEAVGSSLSESEEINTLAESWTAKGLTLQQTPNPKVNSGSELTGISCVSSSSYCVAVGFGLPVSFSETWDGTSWSLVHLPEAASSEGADLSGVSCTSSTACMGVGDYFSSSGVEETFAMSWDGDAWTIEPSVNPSSIDNALFGVSCTSESTCTAAGDMVGTKSPSLLLVEVWDGTSWSTQHAFLKRSALGAGLYNVSCTSTTFCLAVGADELGSSIAEIWNGTDWKLTPAPVGPIEGGIVDVACITSSDCIAVGADIEQDGLAEQWNGKTWTVLQTPAGSGELESLSCTSATACIAVGIGEGETGPTALAESWNGTTWSLMKTPGTGTGSVEVELLDDSCSSAQSCVAVGVSVNDEDIGSPLIESWNGSKWSKDKSAATSVTNLGLTGVSCTSATNCMATGYSFDRFGSPAAYSELWNGKTWTSEKTPSLAGGTVLYGLQCSSATACVTVGGRPNGALAEGWDGKSWTVLKPVNPAGSGTSTFLIGVDCTSYKACTAVGEYANADGLELTLAEAN